MAGAENKHHTVLWFQTKIKQKYNIMPWRLKCLKQKERFRDVAFADETTTEMSPNGRFSFYKNNSSIDPSTK